MSTNNTNGGSDLTNIGAFWKKDKSGKKFLSGKIKLGEKEYTAFVFSNKKDKDNHPDYRLVLSELDEDLIPPAEKARRDNKPAQASTTPAPAEVADDDIPF